MKQMNQRVLIPGVAMILASIGISACQDEQASEANKQDNAESAISKPVPTTGESVTTSPGKPSAPISMRYEILGNAVVGSPVAINVQISATGDQGPVEVHYSISDYSAMVFQQGQVERLQISGKVSENMQQLAVVPQREGRLYVNVSAEVQTPGGAMIKSMAIPIQVGNAPEKPQVNGELVEGPDGETVISMPAKENE